MMTQVYRLLGITLAALAASPESGKAPFPPHEGKAIVFPAPPGIAKSPDYRLFVQGKEVFCYVSKACSGHPFDEARQTYSFPSTPLSYAIFDISGAVLVRIEMRDGLVHEENYPAISPLSRGIPSKFDNGAMEFVIDRPGDLTILPSRDGYNPLHLFINKPETDIPHKNDPNVVSYGPGVHDLDDGIALKRGQTLYLAGGAVVRPRARKIGKVNAWQIYGKGPATRTWSTAAVTADRTDGVKIIGRGILSGSLNDPYSVMNRMIMANESTNLVVRDIVVADGNNFMVDFQNCKHVRAEGVRVLGAFANCDGILFDGTQDGIARRCTLHVYDDCLEAKSMAGRPCHDILYEDCLVWVGCGTAMGVTHETAGPVCNITWRNITVTKYKSYSLADDFANNRASIFVDAAFGGEVSKLRFENITIEEANPHFVYVSNPPRDPKSPSPVKNVVFRNINANNVVRPTIVLIDASGRGIVEGISFENVVVNGQSVTPDDNRFRIRDVKNIGVK